MIPATEITNMAFGKCPKAKNNKCECLYVTTSCSETSPDSENDGAVFVIKNLGATGSPSREAPWSIIYEHGSQVL